MLSRRALLCTAALAAPLPAAASVRPRALVFPADFGAHPDTRTEWWYATGWLADPVRPNEPTHGFQVTFFRSRTALAQRQPPHPSAFAARQLIFAHAALTDLGARRQHHDQRMAREGFGRASAAPGDTRATLGDWHLAREAGSDSGSSLYRARVGSAALGGTLTLVLRTTQPLLLQGRAGLSRKGPDAAQASHYYSQPQLAVEAHWQPEGQRAVQTLAGRGWLDHEWSETLLHPQAVGWDWIGMNLDDGSALTAFRLRRADGSTLWAGGSWRRAGQRPLQAQAFGPDEVRFTPGRRWSSAATGARYPVEWQVETPAGRWTVQALLDAQELDSRGSTGTVYWEGLSALLGPDGRRAGLGYLEMTGYAGRLAL
jgi:predicted secreted hydrolase